MSSWQNMMTVRYNMYISSNMKALNDGGGTAFFDNPFKGNDILKTKCLQK